VQSGTYSRNCRTPEFGRAEIQLDPRVSALLHRYLAIREPLAMLDSSAENPYLFTGRRYGDHLTATAVHHWLARYDVTAEQLFATALYNAYLRGLRHPKILVNAFGIAVPTAVKYLAMIDPRLIDETSGQPLLRASPP